MPPSIMNAYIICLLHLSEEFEVGQVIITSLVLNYINFTLKYDQLNNVDCEKHLNKLLSSPKLNVLWEIQIISIYI